MDIHDYLGVLRRGWTLVVLGVLVGIAAGMFAQQLEEPSYSATSRDLVTSQTTGDISATVQANGLASGRVGSYVLVASSGLVLQPVIDELGLDLSVNELARQITVVAPPGTLVIEITATAATPELARDIANTTSQIFSTVVAEQIDPAPVATPTPTPTLNANGVLVPVQPKDTVTLGIVNIEAAELPTEPDAPIGNLFLVIGAVIGLGLGLVGASLREALDRRISNRKDVSAVTPVPVVGQIRADRSVRMAPLVVSDAPDSSIAETFRMLRTNIDHLRLHDGSRSFVVTGLGRGNGTTTITTNLALAIANTSASVVAIDTNLRSPDLSAILGPRGSRGLTDVLAGEASLDDVLRPAAGGVWLLSIGTRQPRTSELLATPAMRAVLAELRERFDVVLVDAPPIGAASDATVLSGFGGGTILVVPAGTTSRPALADVLAALTIAGTVPAGIVLNRIPRGVRGRRSAGRAATALAARRPRIARPERPAKLARPPKAAKPAKAARRAKLSPKPVFDRPQPGQAPSRFAPDPTLFTATPAPPPAPPMASPGARPAEPPVIVPPVIVPPVSAPALVPPPPSVVSSVPSVPRPVPPAPAPPRPAQSIPSGPVSMQPGPLPAGPLQPGPAQPASMQAAPAPAPLSHPSAPTEANHRPEPVRVTVKGYSNVTSISPAVTRERQARESYALKSRELERAAEERLAQEQALIEKRVREQLAADRRQLGSALEEYLEETVINPARSADR